MTAIGAKRNIFPAYENQLQELVTEHLELKDQPLILALYYAPVREPTHIFLLEIVENFARGNVDPNRELFEVTFGTASGFRMGVNQRLHLILTNPREAVIAFEQDWPLAQEIKSALHQDRYRVLHKVKGEGDLLMRMLRND